MFIGSLYMPNEDATKNFGSCVSQYTTNMIEKQMTDISTTTIGQMTTSVENLNRRVNVLNENVSNTSLTLNQRYNTINTSIKNLKDTYGSESEAKTQLDGKITTFTSEMMNIFNNIKDYVKS
jgi:seryl-tRNA synthetase